MKDRTVLDADWATSDKLVLLTSEGCVRVCGVSLKYSQSPVNTTELAGTHMHFLILCQCDLR